jgi:hypothetical protein
MISKARAWPAVAGGTAIGLAGVICLTATTAGAEPTPPTPATVTQTVTVMPAAGAPVAAPVAPAAPSAPGVPVAPAAPQIAAGAVAAPAPLQQGTVPAGQAVSTAAPLAQSTLTPATSGTLTDFLKGKGVTLEPKHAQDFKALSITLPMPQGWAPVPDPNVPDAFLVVADRVGGDGLYTNNAQVVVHKLLGDFDPKEAITHGFIDSQSLPAWRSTDATLGDFYGFPSSLIEGTYRQNDMTLNTSRRYVIATAGPDKYLVSLSVTTSAGQAVAAATATDAIVNGFRVAPATT